MLASVGVLRFPFDEFLAAVDEEDVTVIAVFLEDHDNRRDARRVEDACRQM